MLVLNREMLSSHRGTRLVPDETRILLILAIAAAFLASFLVARHLGLNRTDPTDRMRFHAIPVAISQIYHGRRHDYTAFRSIALPFQNPDTNLDKAIRDGINAKIPEGDTPHYWTADDRGLSDFVNIGFRLFGPSMPALFRFWFLLLGISIGLAVVGFRRDVLSLSLIACTVIGVGATITAFPRAAGSLGEASIHLSESRMFDVLGLIAAVHLILTTLRPQTARWWLSITIALAQAAFIATLVHARGSVSWLFLVVLAVSVVTAVQRWRNADDMRRLGGAVTVICIVVAAWMGMLLYQRVMFNPAYFDGIGPRTFWHNVLMGMSMNSNLADATEIHQVSDREAVDAVLNDMRRRQDPRLTSGWEPKNILNSLGSHAIFDWSTYETVARDLVIRTAMAHPISTIRLILWDKPTKIVSLYTCRILGLLSTCNEPTLKAEALPPHARMGALHWVWLGLLGLVAACLFTADKTSITNAFPTAMLRNLVISLAAVAMIGLTPSLVVYPGVTQLGGTAAIIYATIGFFAVTLIRRGFH